MEQVAECSWTEWQNAVEYASIAGKKPITKMLEYASSPYADILFR
jgi:hypothetical protein